MGKFIFVILLILCISQACEKDPAFSFKGDDRIYFDYPNVLNSLGEETDFEVDSIIFSFVSLPDEITEDTVWVKVKRVGERASIDKSYSVIAVADSSSAVAGMDFEPLKSSYVFRKDIGVDSFPVIVYREPLKSALNKTIFLKLQETEDFKLGFIEYKTIRLSVSAVYPRPDDWSYVEPYLGDYHYLKYEKWIELTGSTEIESVANSYRNYYAALIQEYFNTNVVTDPITGERITCNI